MKVHLHDHSGHSFTAHLSRHLAARGHDVVHGYSAQFESPHGRLETDDDSPPGLRMQPVSAAVPFVKYSPLRRTRYELSYATSWQRELDRERPDVVLACNVPLFTLARMRRYFAERGQPWVLWHQDIYSPAVAGEAARVLPSRAADLVRIRLERMERAQVAQADAVVAIDESFRAEYERWGLPTGNVHVLPNWASIEEIAPGRRDNGWAERHRLPGDGLRLMYAGTLGRKHNPMLLVEVLDAVLARGVAATLTVASEGAAADGLAAATSSRDDVRVLPFQPPGEVGEMLASADVCLALLEPAAAEFSVPSKVLSYLCAGRPTIALVPDRNAAAVAVAQTGGFVDAPSPEGAQRAAAWAAGLWADAGARSALGARSREYAVRTFDMERIGAEFEKVLGDVVAGARQRTDRSGSGPQRRGVTNSARYDR